MEDVLEAETGSLSRTLKDLFAGAAGGVAQVLLGRYYILSNAFQHFLATWS